MSTLTIKSSLEQHFIDTWTDTSIQFDGEPFDYELLDNWVSLVYTPAINSQYGFDGTVSGRILSEGVLKVFCYAKNVPLSFDLADNVKAFLNGVNVNNVEVGIGSDSASSNLGNGLFEVPVTFPVRYWS